MIARKRKVAALSPAKLNLTLDVIRKRADGFHDIRSLMTRINLYDSLTLQPNAHNSIELTVDDRRRRNGRILDPIPTGPTNLVVQALHELKQYSGFSAGGVLHLTKRIPSQAGLGGGSSNAATALMLANHAWELDLTIDALMEVGERIGSDVPFFLSDSPSICEGRGEKTTKLGGPAGRVHFVLLKPPFGLSTARVFGRYSGGRSQRISHIPSDIACLHRLGKLLSNDLQEAAKELTPWIGETERLFDRLCPLGHQMTGSGTAYFGVCRSAAHARGLAGKLRNRKLGDVYLVRNVTERIQNSHLAVKQ